MRDGRFVKLDVTTLRRLRAMVGERIQDVRQAARLTDGDAKGVGRMLVAFDGSPGAWTALERAVDVAIANRALLTVAAVVGEAPCCWIALSPIALPYTRERMRRDVELEMRRHLAAARDAVPATVSVSVQLLRGRPTRVLATLAQAGGYDLLVTGPCRRSRLGRLFHRSVPHGLLSRGRVSVLTVETR